MLAHRMSPEKQAKLELTSQILGTPYLCISVNTFLDICGEQDTVMGPGAQWRKTLRHHGVSG